MYIDANNDGNLNTQDWQFTITLDPSALSSSNFDTSNSHWTNTYFPEINGAPVVVDYTLAINQTLVADAPNTQVTLQDGADIQNGILIGFQSLVIDNSSGGATVDMSVAQSNDLFPAGGTASEASNSSHTVDIQFSGPGGAVTTTDFQAELLSSRSDNYVSTYDFSNTAGGDTVTLGTHYSFLGNDQHANSQTFIGSNAGGDTVIVHDSQALTGSLEFGGANNVLEVNNGTDLHGATITGSVALDMTTPAGSTVTMTSGQEALFDHDGPMTAPTNSSNVINITDSAGTVVLGVNETVVGQVNLGANTTTVNLSVGNGITPTPGWDLNTLNLGSTSGDTINLNNATPGLSHNSGSDITHYNSIVNWASSDAFHLTLDGHDQTAGYIPVVAPAGGVNLGSPVANEVIDISNLVVPGSLVTNQAANAASVEAYLNAAVNHLTGGAEYTFVISDQAGDSLIYEGHANSSGSHAVDNVDLVGLVTGVLSQNLVHANFV